MEDFEYGDEKYENYTYDYRTDGPATLISQSSCLNEVSCMSSLVTVVIILLLGVCGNGIVIWIAGLKMKKSVNIVWYLSLAISDFAFCVSLPVTAAYMATKEWVFGVFMCKFTSFIMFVNMFSSIFLLVVISVDRCVSVVFPVWAQNHRTVRKASLVVILAWIVSVVLSWPSAVFRETRQTWEKLECFNNYNKYNSTSIHGTVVVSRFVCGFAIPFVIIFFCYSVIICKLKSNHMSQKSSKPFKVMSALIVTFFICWLPYHVFMLLELKFSHYHLETLKAGLTWGSILAFANSFLNPVLYVFMGNDFKQKFRYAMLSKIENAIGEEGRTTSRYFSRSSSVEGRASTHI